MLMPESSALEVKRIRVSRRLLTMSALSVCLLMVGAVAAIGYSVYEIRHLPNTLRIAKENQKLRADLETLDAKLNDINATVAQVEQLDKKLRALTMVSDPDRNLAIGPVGAEPNAQAAQSPTSKASLRKGLLGPGLDRAATLVAAKVDALAEQASGVGSSAKQLSSFLVGQQALLASTPSRRPSQGYVNSKYGMRIDPFTGLPQFHAGLDFSGALGSKVVATADGVVLAARKSGAYGKMVQIDHGGGLVTKYAHLQSMQVRAGDRVRRGQTVGAVGNTGRSTGPHLHYEVRLHGIPQNPERFLLQ